MRFWPSLLTSVVVTLPPLERATGPRAQFFSAVSTTRIGAMVRSRLGSTSRGRSFTTKVTCGAVPGHRGCCSRPSCSILVSTKADAGVAASRPRRRQYRVMTCFPQCQGVPTWIAPVRITRRLRSVKIRLRGPGRALEPTQRCYE